MRETASSHGAIEVQVASGTIALAMGDLSGQRADAIVTNANESFAESGGVDGAVHRAAGPELRAACRNLGRVSAGGAAATPSFGLAKNGAKYVIHAVGPQYQDGHHDEAELLASAYRRSLELADQEGCASVALPAIGTDQGFGYPLAPAAHIAISSARRFLADHAPRNLRRVTFVLSDRLTAEAFASELAGEKN